MSLLPRLILLLLLPIIVFGGRLFISFFSSLRNPSETEPAVPSSEKRSLLRREYERLWPFYLLLVLFLFVAYAHRNLLFGSGIFLYTAPTALLVSCIIASTIYGALYWSKYVKLTMIVILILFMIPCTAALVDMTKEPAYRYIGSYDWFYLVFYPFIAWLLCLLTIAKYYIKKDSLKPTVLTVAAVALFFILGAPIYGSNKLTPYSFFFAIILITTLSVVILFRFKNKPFFPGAFDAGRTQQPPSVTEQTSEFLFCPNCGTNRKEGRNYCTKCGYRFSE